MYCPLTFRVKRFDIFLEKNPRGNLELWLLFSLFYVMKQRLGSEKKVNETKTTVFGSSKMTFTAELQSDACIKFKKLIHLSLIEIFV